MQELRANTQVIVRIGPFVDVGDGFTPQIDIDITGTNEAELLKAASVEVDINGRTWAATTACRGWYDLTLTTDDTDTEGTLVVVVQDDSDCLPVFGRFMVLAQAAWDSKYVAKDTGFMDINIKAVSEDETAADNLELQYDGTGLIGDTFPFTQAAGAALGGGLSILTTMASATAILGDSNNLSNANTSDDSRWTADDNGAGAETIFRCTPADTLHIPVALTFEGYYDEPAGATNGATLQVYNFNTAGWDTIATFANSTKDEDHEIPLSHAHRSPGTDTIETVAVTIGDVLIKFKQDAQETGNNCLLIDYMVVGFVGGLVTAADVVDEWETQSQADPTGFHVNTMEVDSSGAMAQLEAAVDNAMDNAIPSDGSPTARSRDDFLLRAGAQATANETINETSGAYSLKKIDDEATQETFGNSKAGAGTITSTSGVTTRNPT